MDSQIYKTIINQFKITTMKRKLLLLTFVLTSFNWLIGQTYLTTCYPDNANYNSGTTNGSNFTDPSDIFVSNNNGSRGWVRFNTSAIPDGVEIESMSLVLYSYTSYDGDPMNWTDIKLFSMENDPLSGSAASVYTDAGNGRQMYNYWIWNNEPHWNYFHDLHCTPEMTSNLIDNDWLAVGVTNPSTGAQWSSHVTFDGWDGDNKPYIRIYYSFLPTCPAPTVQTESNITQTSVDLAWTTGGASKWDIEYGLTGFAPGSGTTITATENNPYTLSGLTAGKQYDWYVRDNCEDEQSEWAGPSSFVTACSTSPIFPFTEDFETPWLGTPAAPVCWSQITVSGTKIWEQSETSPHGGTKCANAPFEFDGGEHLLITPKLDFGTSNYRLKFWLKGGISSGTDLKIQIAADNSNANNFTTDLAYFIAGENMPTVWTQIVIDLSDYENGQYIAFRTIDADGFILYIDDVTVEEIQDVAPESATVTFPTNELVTLNNPLLRWAPSLNGEPVTGYKVYLSTTNPPSTDVALYDGVATSFQTSGLTAGTQYYWQVVPYNTHGDAIGASVWSFTTITDGYLAESFESVTFPPTGWANPGNWSKSNTQFLDGYASAYKLTTATASLLSTPKVTLTASSKLDFFAKTTSENNDQRIQLKYSTDEVNWTNIGAEISLASAGPWTPYSIDLSSLAGNDYYLAIAAYNIGTSGSVYLDHVIGPMITLFAPDAVTLVAPSDAATNQSITPTLSWTAAATGGVPTGYKIYLDENPNPTNLYADVAASPYTVSPALSYDTKYYWKVVAHNGTVDGAASATRSFTTRADPTLIPDFTETFASVPPENWTRAQGLLEAPVNFSSSTSGWLADGFANAGTTGSAKVNIYGTSRKEWLISPPINLGNDAKDYRLTFDLALTAFGSTNVPNLTGTDDKFAVVISTDNGASWSSANTLQLWDNNGSASVYNSISNTGENVVIDLSPYSGLIQIGFYGESTVDNASNDLFVDNVTVEEISSSTLSWYNLQWPGTATINESQNETIFTQCWEGGVTNLPGAGTGIESWIGYSTTNSNPNTWTNWVVATYNQDVGNNDEYMADLGTLQDLAPGTYYYASRYRYLDGPFTYGGFDGGAWDGTTNVSGVLTVTEFTVTNFPYVESFETNNVDGTAIANYWIQEAASGADNWTANNTETTFNRSPRTGSWNAFLKLSNDRWLFQGFTLVGGISYTFEMYARQDGPTATDASITVKYGVSHNAAAMTNDIVVQTGIINGDYQRLTAEFTPAADGNYYIGINGNINGTPNYISIDDISLIVTPTTPVFAVSPVSKDFGIVKVGESSTAQTFTISNIGIGTLEITGAALNGINGNQFNLADLNTYPIGLTNGQSITVDVTFAPDSEGVKIASLDISDDQGNGIHQVTLTGSTPPQGSVCDNPLPLVFQADITGNTSDYSNDYSSTDITFNTISTSYLDGDDVVYQFTVNSGTLSGEISTTGNWMGAFILADCPNSTTPPKPIIDKGSGSGDLIFFNDAIVAGTYFLIISSKPGPQSIAYSFNLTFTEYPATATWTGATNSDWDIAENWDNGIPGLTTNVILPAGLFNYPTIYFPVSCNDITLQSTANGTASLLENGYLTVHGNATIQRYIKGGGYHFVSVPINGTLTAGLFMNSYVYDYDVNTQAWTGVGNDPDATITNDQGYMIWYTGNNTTYNFSGNLISGAFTAATPSSGAAQSQYNLVPNPYPSAIDWNAWQGWTKTNLNDAIYIWNRMASGGAQYASYAGGIGVNGGSQFIPVGQSFFVETDGLGAPVLTMDNDVRTHSDQAFYKSNQQLPDLLRIKTTTENGDDEIVVRLLEDATQEFDGAYDASKLFGSETLPQLYSLTSDERMLSINSIALEDKATVVPVGFEWASNGEASLNFTELESFDPNITIFLEDLLTGKMIDLREQQVYTFMHDEGNEALRFRLHFKSVVGVDEQQLSAYQVWSYDSKVYVSIPALTGDKALIQLVDAQGKVVYEGEHHLSNPEIIHVHSNQQVLIARVITGTQVYTQKVFIR